MIFITQQVFNTNFNYKYISQFAAPNIHVTFVTFDDYCH